ncbi:MAG: polysaccharide deacetylase family protein [Treponema sp.]|jgi:peptidoglycan/xylan/chitin deacetylase (PgdA/CDA1 family)|nr:polysaccharide deacetylase family protein [Treponema sp.]
MKDRLYVLGLALICAAALASCAGNRPVLRAEPVPHGPPADTGAEPVPQSAPTGVPESPESVKAMYAVIQRVKQNSPEIKKYFLLDEDSNIIVKADLTEGGDEFEVMYDLKNARSHSGVKAPVEVGFAVVNKRTADIKQDSLQWSMGEDAAGLLLGFDDNYQAAWERHFEVFAKYGAKVTFFVQGELDAFCTAALAQGHDVGYHSLHHLNLTKVSPEVFFEETLSAVDGFRQQGIPLRAFAYPYGLWEPWMEEELAKVFKIRRGYGVTFRVYDGAAIRKGYISSKAIDNLLYKHEEDFEAIITIMFRTIKFIGGESILPLTTHDISDTADWGIMPHRLEYVLQTAKDLKLRFYRYGDFF